MSVRYLVVRITCDRCGLWAQTGGIDHHTPAIPDGWGRFALGDLCPDCMRALSAWIVAQPRVPWRTPTINQWWAETTQDSTNTKE